MDTSSLNLDDGSVSLGKCILTLTTGRHNRSGQCLWKIGREAEPGEPPLRMLGKKSVAGRG
jgi:hypothetical protein